MADDYTMFEVQKFLDDVQDKIDELQSGVNNVLQNLPWWVPDWAIDPVYDKWNELMDAWGAAIQDLQNLLDNIGEAWTLRASALAWRQEVEAETSSVGGTIGLGQLSTDDVFSGVSANAYRSIVPGQQQAANAMKPQYTTKVAEGLDDTADAINKSLSTVQEALVALGVAVAGAIVAIAGAAAVIPLIAGIVTCIGAMATFAVKMMNAKDQLIDDCQAVVSSWDGALEDWTNFDTNNSWPKAVFPA
ncbi:hypothetical protein GCM10023340_21650 [Nocardioides marinquilinus]|uniref:WXG100 family type VII secretion target n=1 Tax=Nocardioides marinquilinus TaxID=1210400 RepID=A0ABP9PKU7_9ACTN